MTLKNIVFWNVTPCASCENQRLGGSITFNIMMDIFSELGTLSVISTKTSVLTRTTRRHIPEDDTLQNKMYFKVNKIL
jgi:hypothetical protein